MRRSAWQLLGAASGLGLLAAGVGCTALAGIDEGTLATAGDTGAGDGGATADGSSDGTTPLDGSQPDGAKPDGTVPPGDASVTDGATDSAAPLPVTCSLNPGSAFIVDDLSRFDAGNGSLHYQHALWVLPAGIGDGAYLVTQGQSENNDFLLYQVSFGQHSAMPTTLGSTGLGGVQLLDVEQTPSGPAALTTVGNGMPQQQGLQVVSLPATWGASAGVTTAVTSPASPVLNNANGNGATFTSPVSGRYDWIMGVRPNGSGTEELLAGTSANPGSFVTLVPPSAAQFSGNNPLFDLGGNLYSFVQGLGDAGSGEVLLAFPDNVSGPGVQAPVTTSSPYSGIISAHASTTNAGKAAVLGATIDTTSGNAQIWAGQLAPASLTSLTLGAPQFTAGSSLSLSEVPFDNGKPAAAGDQLFLIGTPQGGGGSLILVWLGADGRAIARPSMGGPLVTSGNVINMSAVGVSNAIAEVFANLFIAWIEQVTPDSGPSYDRLWASKASCAVAAGG